MTIQAEIAARDEGVQHASLDAAIAAYDKLFAEEGRFQDEVLTPATEAYWTAHNAVPHFNLGPILEEENPSLAGGTADEKVVQRARSLVTEDSAGDRRPTLHQRCCRAIVAADDERKAAIAALQERKELDELRARHNALVSTSTAAYGEAKFYPVETLADLLKKLEFLERDGDEEIEIELLVADLRRIEGRALT